MSTLPTIHNNKHFFQGGAAFFQLPDIFVQAFKPTELTPSVENLLVFKCTNTAPAMITHFLGGQNGQTIKILGDGFTTVDHGTWIFTNTGADKLLAANLVYTFTFIDGAWYENAP